MIPIAKRTFLNGCLSLTDMQTFSSFLLSNFMCKELVCVRPTENKIGIGGPVWWHTPFNFSTGASRSLVFEVSELQVSQGCIVHSKILSFFIGFI